MPDLTSLYAMESVLRHPLLSAWSYEISGLAANDLSVIGATNLSRLAYIVRDFHKDDESRKDIALAEYLEDLASTAVAKPLLPLLRDKSYAEVGDRMIVYFQHGSSADNIPGRTFVKDVVVAENLPGKIKLGIEGLKETKEFVRASPYLLTERDFSYLSSGMDMPYSYRWFSCQLTGPFQIDLLLEDMLKQIKHPDLFSLRPEDLND